MQNYVATATGMKAWPLAGQTFMPNTLFPQRRSIELIGLNQRASYETLYRTQPWVHTVVNKLSRGIARLPLGTFEDVAEGAPKPREDSGLAELLRRPYPRASAFNLKEAITGSLAVYGHALVALDYGGAVAGTRPPVALWPIPWRYVGIIAGENEPIAGYLIEIGGLRRFLLPEDVLHFMWWSPEFGLGISPLEPLRTTLALEDAAQRYSVGSFANGARPSGAITTDQPLKEPDRKKLRAEIEATHGGIDNAFRMALMTHGMKWEPFSHSAVEAELINLRKLTREEVCAVYDIAPPMVQILDKATFSNVDEQHRMLYQDTYAPWTALEEETFAVQLIDRVPAFRGLSVHYDMDGPLRGNEDARSIAAQRWFQSATKTPNEMRADEGRPPVLGSVAADGTPDPKHPANQVYVPVNMLPASHVLASLEAPAPGSTDGQPGPGGDHQPTPNEVRAFIRALEAAGIDTGVGNGVNGNGGGKHLEESLVAILKALTEREAQPPSVHIAFPEGFVKSEVQIDAAPETKDAAPVNVEVVTPDRKPVSMKFERDGDGRIVRAVPDTPKR